MVRGQIMQVSSEQLPWMDLIDGITGQRKEIVAEVVIGVLLALVLLGPGTPTARADLGDQLFKLTASDAAPLDWFGHSVAISGGTALVGAPVDSTRGDDPGGAYLFDAFTGQQLSMLTAEGTDKDFGYSVAIGGNVAIVGSPFDSDPNGIRAGSAYLFDVVSGAQLMKLNPADGIHLGFFGWSVALSGNTALIGAIQDTREGVVNAGAAYLFDVTTGQQLAKLTAPLDECCKFGNSVAISGDTAIVGFVGDPLSFGSHGSHAGSAYLFDVATGERIAKLTASDPAALQYFGSSVAISGDRALVGAYGDRNAGIVSGAAYVFDVNTGEQLWKLIPNDAVEINRFGWSVSLNGNTAVIGTPGDNDRLGSAYLFDIATGAQLAKLTPSDGAVGAWFGNSVSIGGDKALVGANYHQNQGAAYLFSAVPEPGRLPGDVNEDDILDVADIDELSLAIRQKKTDSVFDLDNDGDVAMSDHEFLVKDELKTWYGDATLDGTFDSADLVEVFQAGQYEDGIVGNSTWGTGDWNADGDFTSSDLVKAFQDGGYEKGPLPSVKPVPEPRSAIVSLVVGVLCLCVMRRRTH